MYSEVIRIHVADPAGDTVSRGAGGDHMTVVDYIIS